MQYKKILAPFLSVSMIVGLFAGATPAPVSAAEIQTTNNLSNTVEDYTDPWVSTQLPALQAPSDQNVEDIKFTNKEYTGLTVNGIANEDVFGVNREEASVFSTTGIVYDSVEKALAGAKDYNREGSAFFQMLTGEGESDWELTVVKNAEEASADAYKDFYKEEYEIFSDSKASNTDYNYGIWKSNLQLPANWEYYGFDYSIYTNDTVPWQAEDNRSTSYCPAAPVNFNPVGLYRKTFTVDESLKTSGGRIYLNLQGAESAYYVYVNGKEVGYSEDSFDPHSFDVTDYLKDGENLLAIKVHRFSDGTWFELQDMYQDGGIFRDIYLYTAPLVHIDDYFITTDLDENYEHATMNLDLTVRNSANTEAKGYKVDVRLYNEDGTMFFNGMTVDIPAIPAAEAKTGNEMIIEHTNIGEASANATVYSPELWSAEKPNLYYLVLSLYSEDGVYMGSMAQQHGFREIEFTRTDVNEDGEAITPTEDYQQITINGERLLLKGANRHETDPVYGKYISHEVMELDGEIMQQNNINAVSTAHYTNDDYFYYLCNKYGLYVNAEPNLECHQLQSAGASDKMALCKEMILDRGKAALEQLKNCTSIVVWEDNNECYFSNDKNYGGGAMYDLLWYFKNEDGTRPVVDAGNTDTSTYGMGNGADLSNHGYSERYVMEDLSAWERPWLMTEYAHSMGNATGSLMDYWEYVRANEFALGGFIWDLVDQGRIVSIDGDESAASFAIVDSANGRKGQVNLSSEDSYNDVTDAKALTSKSISNDSYIVFEDKDGAFNKLMGGTGKSFTMEAICKPTSLSGNQIIVAKGDTQIAIKTNAGGQLEMFAFYNGAYYTMTAAVPNNWLNNWHQVAGVYDNGTMSLYVDGALLVSMDNGTNGLNESGELFSFGYQTDEKNTFSGEISLGRVYNRALTAAEIQAQNSVNPAITAESTDVFLWVDTVNMSEDTSDSMISSGYDYYGQEYAKETLYDNAGNFYSYGGDNGEVYHNGNFCQNGLLLPDRTVQPEMYEVKYVYQNFWFTATEDSLKEGKVDVLNETSFTNLNEYKVTWELLEDGISIGKGSVDETSVDPWATETLSIPYLAALPETLKEGGEYYLNLSVQTVKETDMVPAGHEIAYEQFKLPVDVKKVEYTASSEGVVIDESGDVIAVSGKGFHFDINKETGIIENYYYGKDLLLEQGPVPNYWRALVDNDKMYDRSWADAAKDLRAEKIVIGKNDAGTDAITVTFAFPNQPALKQSMTYVVEGNGAVTISTTVDATQFSGSYDRFIRIGTNLVLPSGYEAVTWYGNGPVEALWDRENFARVGIYETTVNDLFFPYMAANDTGTLTGTTWFTITSDSSNSAIAMASYNPLEFSALHFTQDDLDEASHPYELTYQSNTYLGINYRSQGTGNATCGPDVWSEYVLPTSQTYSYSYTLIPYEKGADVMALTRMYRKALNAEMSKMDAELLSQKIDALNVSNASQKEYVLALMDEYNNLTSDGQSHVGINRYTKLEEALELVEKLENGTMTISVKDKGRYGFDLEMADQPDMTLADGAMTGYGDVKGENADAVYKEMFTGTKPFTVDVVFNPNGDGSGPNMIFSKGDECTAMRIHDGAINFYVYEGNDTWTMISTGLSSAQLNSWQHITGVYTGDVIQIYVNGSLTASAKVGALIQSDYPLGIGYCPQYPATSNDPYLSWGSFRSVHIFNRALSANEISNDSVTSEDEAAVLWYDFAKTGISYVEDGKEVAAVGIRISATELELESGDKETIYADAVPYYSGQVVYSVDDTAVVTVNENGVVTAKKAGTAIVTIAVEGTDISTEVVVSVLDKDATAVEIANRAKEVAQQAEQLAEEAAQKAEEAKAAVEALGEITTEDAEAAEKAQAAAEAAQKEAVAAKEAAQAAEMAAKEAEEAAQNSSIKTAEEALKAANEALAAAEKASEAAASANEATLAQCNAQIAQEKAEEAAQAAEEAEKAAEEAVKAAEEAANSTAKDKTAAQAAEEAAKAAKELAKTAKEEAETAKEAAQKAAEEADASNVKAAEEAMKAAEEAAKAAEAAKLVVTYATKAAQAQVLAQKAQEAAEKAANAAEEAQKKAEEEATARKEAAELATAKQGAVLKIALYKEELLKKGLTTEQEESLDIIVNDTLSSIDECQETERIEEILADMKESVEVMLAETKRLAFEDVFDGEWFYDAVEYVSERGLMVGISDTLFAPNVNITKAQVAQVLYNMESRPEVTDKSVFTELKDVYEVEWYANAVAWAYNNNIVTGDLNSKEFSPNADVSREQLALMMYRYAKYKKYDVSASSDLAGLNNAENTSDWALDAVKWAVGFGLISGVEANGEKDLQPQGNATRAQMAAILQRFCEADK